MLQRLLQVEEASVTATLILLVEEKRKQTDTVAHNVNTTAREAETERMHKCLKSDWHS